MKPRTALVLLFLFLIVINIGFYLYNKTQSCDKCKIQFTQIQRSGVPLDKEDFIRINSTPTDLYNSLLNNTCIIRWDEVNGYYK